MKSEFLIQYEEHLHTFSMLPEILPDLERASDIINTSINMGNKVMLCGNGGSAADSQHIAAEIIGRFETERKALPAIALTTDTSILTALGNDYGYKHIFSRQVEGLAIEGDVLIAYSTSGNSENILEAAKVARKKHCKVIGLTGKSGGKLMDLADVNLRVKSLSTARIQEAHAFIGHFLCSLIDAEFS